MGLYKKIILYYNQFGFESKSIVFIFFCQYMLLAKTTFQHSVNGEKVVHSNFRLSYLEDHEQAEWVYYKARFFTK